MRSEPPALFADRFEVVDVLAAGGMGVVYSVLDRRTGAACALKTMSHVDGDTLARFKAEFRAVADLRHPNLVRLEELFETNREWFFTMELVDGVDVGSYVRRRRDGLAEEATGPRGALFEEGRLRSALRQLATALCVVHGADRVHRDVKPSNVLVTPSGRVVLLDFGLAVQTVGGGSASDDVVVGTAAYMAPEQAAAQAIGPAVDWYAVGVLLFEALTGRLPFEGAPLEMMAAKRARDAPRPDDLTAGLPADLAALCDALLARDPRARPSGAEVLRLLGADAEPLAARAPAAGAPLIGRDRAVAAIAAALDDARTRAVLQLVVAESGEGKTALIRALVRDLAGDRAEVLALVGRCHQRESVSFKAFDGLVDELGRALRRLGAAQLAAVLPPELAPLGHLFPSLCQLRPVGAAVAAAPSIDDPAEARARGFAAFRGLLARLAERWRLLIVIDDFHRADQDSVDLLSYVLGGPDAPPGLVVLTARPSGVLAILDQLATADRLVRPRSLELEPLPVAAAGELARLLLARHGHADDALIAALVDEADGHPGYMVELARAGVDPASRSGGRSLDDLLWARIAALPALQRDALGVLAVAGSPSPLFELGPALGLEHDALLAELDALSDLELVTCDGRWTDSCVEPYHGRVAETIASRASSDDLRAWHARLLDALMRTGPHEPERLLSHALAAGRSDAIGHYAAAAAVRAVQARELPRAARLYRLALEHGAPADRRQVRVELGAVLADAGDSLDAAEQYLAAADEPGGDSIDLHRRAADQLVLAGEVGRALARYEDILTQVGARPARGRRATLVRLAWARLRLRARLRGGARAARPASPAELARLEAFGSVGQALSTIDTLRGAEYQARFLILALEVGDASQRCRGLALEACYVATGGHAARGRVAALIERAAELATATGAPIDRGRVALGRAIPAMLLGDFAAMQAAADDALAWLAAGGGGAIWEQRNARIFGILARYFLGDLREFAARTRAAIRDADARRDRYTMAQLRGGIPNAIWLMDDEPGASEAEAEQGLRDWAPPSYQLPSYYHAVAIAQAQLYAGDGASARRGLIAGWPALLASLLLRVDFLANDMAYLRGRAGVAAALAGDGAGLDDAARCAAQLRARRAPWARPLARLLDAARAAQRGHPAAAVDELTIAVDELAAAGMAMHAAAARRALAALTGAAAWVDRAAADERGLSDAGVVRPDRWLDMLAPGFAPRA